MLESDAIYLGVATDHVIESFRNRLWPDYKTGAGIERVLLAQFHPLEEALIAMGVVVWPMIDLEADDALASAAHLAAQDASVWCKRTAAAVRFAMSRLSAPRLVWRPGSFQTLSRWWAMLLMAIPA